MLFVFYSTGLDNQIRSDKLYMNKASKKVVGIKTFSYKVQLDEDCFLHLFCWTRLITKGIAIKDRFGIKDKKKGQ